MMLAWTSKDKHEMVDDGEDDGYVSLPKRVAIFF